MLTKLKKHKIILITFRLLFTIIGKFPKNKKMVLFESFHGKQYSDSPRAIYEYMRQYHPDLKLVWSIDKRSIRLFKTLGVPYVRRFTPRWFWIMPRSKYWVNNVRFPRWMPRSASTVYLQTWHGTPLKKLGLDIDEVHMPDTDTTIYRYNIIKESENWSLLVSPNNYSSDIFRSSFGFKGEVIESGYPRNDILYNADLARVQSIRADIGIPVGKKVILYAPTWRDDDFFEKGRYKFKFQFDLDTLKSRFGEEFILLTRMHYLVAENFNFAKYEGFVKDVSTYPDIAELYLVSDMLITDYSSVFFDYANLNRPIIFYMYDLEDYRDRLRGFYFEIEKEAPGPIVENEADLLEAIAYAAEFGHKSPEAFKRFGERFCYLEDGGASKRVVERLLEEGKQSER